MTGTLVNAGAIVLGGLIGWLAPRQLPARQQVFLKTLLGIIALLLGLRIAWFGLEGGWVRMTVQFILALLALVAGHVLGRFLGLQRGFNTLGRHARERFTAARKTRSAPLGDGFVSGAILFCLTPLAIIGPIQEGLQNDFRVLLLKAAMDGLTAVAFGRVFGFGTMMSALPVLAFQGTLTLLGRVVAPLLGHAVAIQGWNVVAGLLVAISSLVVLDVRKIPLANYLPALAIGPLLYLMLLGGPR